MRQIILYIAASLDHYIARPDGDIDWLHAPEYSIPGEDYGYQAFYDTVDTVMMGNKTYQQICGFDVPYPYTGKTNVVFSRRADIPNAERVTVVSEDIPGMVRKLKKAEGKNIWLVGGGQINTLFLQHDLIDRIILTLIPVTLGIGIPLFDGPAPGRSFQLQSCQTYTTGLVQLAYRKKV